MKRLLNLELTLFLFVVVFNLTGLSVLGQQEVVIDSYPPGTTVEQGESIVLVCSVVGVLPSATLSYSWTCRNGRTCEGTEVVSGNTLRIGAISDSLHGGTFRCSVTGSGVSVSGTFTLTVTDGLVLSAQGSAVRDYFIPRDSFITDSSLITSGGSSAVVACRSTNRNPMWSYPNGTVVTTVTTINVYQNIRNNMRSDLIIGDVSTFTNGDYTCTGTFTGGSISAVLELYIMSVTSLDPPTSLMLGTVNATSIVVTWSGAGSPVNAYYISWRRTDLGDSATAEYARVTGATMHNLTNLFAGVTYNITVWSTDGTGVSSPVSHQVTTRKSAPTAPRLLRVVDSSSCQLDWLPPAQPNGAVTYTVQYQTSGSFMDSTTGLNTTHHSAVNLPSGTSVTVRVQAVNTAGTNTSNTVVLQDHRPVSPMAVLTSPNTITVSWSAPTGMTCSPIDDYTVVYNNGTGNMTIFSSTSPLMLPNLQHGTTYSLFVAARSEGVSGVSVATNPPSITTLLAAPAFGTSLTNSTSVRLTWSPVTPGSVQSYRLTITGRGTQQTATVLVPGRDHVFSNLTAFTNYTVTIAAVDTMNREGLMANRTVTTTKPVLQTVAVVNTPQALTSTSVMVSWSPADDADNGTVTGYQLTVVILGATDNTTNSSFTVDGGSTTTATLTSLVPGVPYLLEVRVIGSLSELGPPRASSVFFSQETDADPDVQVSNLDYDMDSEWLSWTPITLFEARHFFNYSIIATPCSSHTQKKQNSSTIIVPYSNCGDVCSVQLTLSPNTNYLVTVAITRSTNVGVTVAVIMNFGPTTPNSNTECSCVLTCVISGIVTGVVVAVLTGFVMVILMYVIVKCVRTSTTKTPEEVVYEEPFATHTCGEVDHKNIELSPNPAYVSMDAN